MKCILCKKTIYHIVTPFADYISCGCGKVYNRLGRQEFLFDKLIEKDGVRAIPWHIFLTPVRMNEYVK